MFYPCFRLSLQKGAKYIAIADIIICILCSTIRLPILYYQQYPEDESSIDTADSSEEILTGRSTHHSIEYTVFNVTTTATPFNDKRDGTAYSSSSEELHHVTKHVGAHFSEDQVAEKIYREHEYTIFIIYAITEMIGFVGNIFLELVICRLLLGAASKRDAAECKKWFWVRFTLTVFTFMMSIIGITALENDWVDLVLDSLVFYRIYELFVVNEFRKEIVGTCGPVRFGV